MKLRDLGKRICKANRPATFDWPAKMGVAASRPSAHAKKPANPKKAAATSIRATASSVPASIPTPHGEITIRDIGGDYAVRNPAHPDIIKIVKGTCKGRGKWNPRYRNWIIGKNEIISVATEISAKVAAL